MENEEINAQKKTQPQKPRVGKPTAPSPVFYSERMARICLP